MGQFLTTSQHRHIAYQIKGNKKLNANMILMYQYNDSTASRDKLALCVIQIYLLT